MIVEGADLDLGDLRIMPGLVNAHDHLQFALFPRLGSGPYPSATEWARDIYFPDRDPVRAQLRVPKPLRLIWGGLRNLMAGVTTVSHHDAYHPIFDEQFPVRVVQRYGWAHSLAFTDDVRAQFDATPAGAPFLIHLGEGTNEAAAEEILRLHGLGALGPSTVLVHAAGLNSQGWDLVASTGASVIWCPRSNLFTLGRTIGRERIESGIPIALGTDSPLTAEGDLLDEIAFASGYMGIARARLCDMVGDAARRILRFDPQPEDWIACREFGARPELVVIGGSIRLIGETLAQTLPGSLHPLFHRLSVEGRRPVWLRWNIPELLRESQEYLGHMPIRLGGLKLHP